MLSSNVDQQFIRHYNCEIFGWAAYHDFVLIISLTSRFFSFFSDVVGNEVGLPGLVHVERPKLPSLSVRSEVARLHQELVLLVADGQALPAAPVAHRLGLETDHGIRINIEFETEYRVWFSPRDCTPKTGFPSIRGKDTG